MRKIILMSLLSIPFIHGHTKAQTTDSTELKKFEEQTVYLNGSLLKYYKNNQKKRIGFLGKKLKSEFTNCTEETQQELSKYKTDAKRGVFFLTVSTVAFGALIVAAPIVTGPVILGLAGTMLVSYTGVIIEAFKAPGHLEKAIWLHNRDVMAKQ